MYPKEEAICMRARARPTGGRQNYEQTSRQVFNLSDSSRRGKFELNLSWLEFLLNLYQAENVTRVAHSLKLIQVIQILISNTGRW